MHAPTACRRAGSGSLSTPCAGCFSPFPHGTCSLSVSRECLALPDGPGGFRRDFSCPALLRWRLVTKGHFAHGAVTRCGRTFQTVTLCSLPRRRRSYNPRGAGTPRVWAMPRSLAATGGITVVFSSCGVYGIRPYGLTHSDTHGSRAACAYPWIFAACRVLLRLREPRHPPRALLQLPEASTPEAWGGHVSFRFDSFTRLSCLSLTCAEFVYRITLSNMP